MADQWNLHLSIVWTWLFEIAVANQHLTEVSWFKMQIV